MRVPCSAIVAAFLAATATDGCAQCNPSWVGGTGIAGTDGTVERVIEWDPDGPGPATSVLVLAGSFTTAATLAVSSLAAWDPATGAWSAFAPSTGQVSALATAPNGDLFVARRATSTTNNRIERWTGSAWAAVGGPLYYGPATAMAVRPNGTLVASFQSQFAGGISEWNGTSWTEFGSITNGFVVTFTLLANGDVAASVYQAPMSFGVVRWNGSTWTSLLPGPNGIVNSLAELPNGDIVAGSSGLGTFPTFTAFGAQAVQRLARWNGTSWGPFGGDADGDVFTLQRMTNGDIVAGGSFGAIGTVAAPRIARWNGAAWQPVAPIANGPLASSVRAVCERPTGLVIGGSFRSVAGVPAANVALQQGSGWTSLAPAADGFDGSVFAIATLPGGGHVVGGAFTAVGSTVAPGVARWNGSAWVALGAGTDNTVRSVVALANGDVVAGGDFATAGGVPANGIARWDGAAWNAMPGGVLTAPVNALARLPNGDVVAADASRIAQWNGSAWTVLGVGTNVASSLATSATGQLFAVGTFPLGSGFANRVAVWSGTTWSPFALSTFPLNATLVTMPNGDLVTASTVPFGMTVLFQFVRWNGSAWTPYGTQLGTGRALGATPDGDLLISAGAVTRWNGSAWVAQPSTNSTVWTMASAPDGSLLVGGDFTMAGGQPAGRFARFTSTCPASAAPLGSGCTGSAGPLTLTATSLPWLGGTFRARTTGMPANSLGLAVTSDVPTTVPLSLVSPVAGPGCDGLLSVVLSDVLLPNGGVADSGFALPDLPAFVGLPLYHYVAALEFGPGGALVALTSTNRLALVLGVF